MIDRQKKGNQASPERSQFSAPTISLPKGGGAIRGIGEKFAANPVTGTGSMTVPLATSPGRSGFGPQLSLSYDSGSGNGPFGYGWSLSLPSITRKTDKGLPQYDDADESDVFILSGAEDLVPVFDQDPAGNWVVKDGKYVIREKHRTVNRIPYLVRRYRPRVEGLFARIERWTNVTTGEMHWRSITRDNVTTLYGKDNSSRIFDPADPSPAHPTRVFGWLICESYDDKGNAIIYQYAAENDENIDPGQANERNRMRAANRYLKRIKYGNLESRLIQPDLTQASWMFEVVFDYAESHYEGLPLDPARSEAEQHRFVRASSCPELPWDSLRRNWATRPDPFSSYRAGFEVRTYRLCHRVLMFHHFPQELGIDDCLVRSTEFSYSASPVASFISGVTQSGYVRQPTEEQPNRYLKKSLPPLEFEYSQVPSPEQLAQQPIRDIDAKSLENLPVGLDGASYQWMDLDGEGTFGILTEQADGWYYKRNLSANNQVGEDGHERTVPRFGPTEVVASKPAVGLAAGAQFLDLAGDGQVDLVQMEGAVRGFYERTDDASWAPFQSFISWPDLSTRDPDLKFVDLTGDGHADILIAEGEALTWYPSLAEDGFGPAVRVTLPSDEEQGPRLVFADGTQSIYLADLSGDGLSDLVRIRNGDVCYWPNLGYGRFGAKVTMDHAPWFDSPDQFDQRRIRLADTDGSGTTDILYLRRDGVHIYFNQSGNRWSDAVPLPQFPPSDNVSSVQALDLLGNGTACLVWSSPLPGNTRQPMRYLALMEDKPHLLVGVKNNLGAETQVHYAPSTKFYLDDKHAGKPWISRLPFPVHVVERVETIDRISRNRFVTRYAYHHGYFDGVEREFRGFGMVEQWDTEEFAALGASDSLPDATNIDAASHVPPVLIRTWFHTGAFIEGGKISRHFEDEYYGAPPKTDPGFDAEWGIFEAGLLPDTVFPKDIRKPDGSRDSTTPLSSEELGEGVRALKGSILRQEIYAEDGSRQAPHPYTVSERNYTIECFQPRGSDNRHAVFFAHPRETIDYHYERNPDDPRVQQALTLEVDAYGSVLKSLAIGYGRRKSGLTEPQDKGKQTTTLITYTENDFTKAIDDTDKDPDNYRAPLPCETRTYELTGFKPENNAARFSFDEWTRDDFALPASAAEIPYEQAGDNVLRQKRPIEHVRTLYRKDDLSGPSKLGDLESRALPYENYRLAFTPTLLTDVYGSRVAEPMLKDGGYVHSESDSNWWIPSGRMFYSRAPGTLADDEFADAKAHFFLPRRFQDPFGQSTFVDYAHDLLIASAEDAVQNRTSATNDFRVLQPKELTDPNDNHVQVAFDALGMVVGTVIQGKVTAGSSESGDSQDNFAADLAQAEIDAFFADPKGHAAHVLQQATTRIIYDLDCFKRSGQPVFAATIARENHLNDPPRDGIWRFQVSLSYSDGFGREIQKKIQAEPGTVEIEDAAGNIKIIDTAPNLRWVGSGWTIYNNKGKPVRQYEPFFSTHHQFQFGKKVGVSPILFYDPVERVVATLHPNNTYEKVVFDPWQQTTWDVNDTAALDPRTDPDVKGLVERYLASRPAGWKTWLQKRVADQQNPPQDTRGQNPERDAAVRTLAHAATPTVAHLDTLGQTFLTIADNGNSHKYPTRVLIDIEGNQREVRDAVEQGGDRLGRIVMRYDYDMLSNRIHQASMEAGERWTLNDVTGKPLRAWDSRGHAFSTEYDQLRRPIKSIVMAVDLADPGRKILFERTIYGEQHPDDVRRNLRGREYMHFDQVGVVTNESYDFDGNLLHATRRLAQDYREEPGWQDVDAVLSSDGKLKVTLASLEDALIPLVESETFISRTRYDALNRPIQIVAPHSSGPKTKIDVIQPIYNEANLLERLDAWLQQDAEPSDLLDAGKAYLHAVTDIDYNAKGQRTLVEYGNDASTVYTYDPLTFRLVHLLTRRDAVAFPDDCLTPPPEGWPGCQVQNLSYTYDPAGNITHIRDDAQQTIYFRNTRVEPSADYTYDAIYRLIEATGREHLGQVGGAPVPHSYNDAPRVGLLSADAAGRFSPNDGSAMGTYVERYVYDAVGNFSEMQHRGTDPANPGWTRAYAYAETSLIEDGTDGTLRKTSNRLTSTTISATETYSTNGDGYDGHGNMLHMPHLPLMRWDYKDQLHATSQQVVNNGGTPETTYYVYDASGQRMRKVTERQAAAGQTPTRMKERIYLGSFEIYREYDTGGSKVILERETLHIMDDKQRIAMVETRTQGTDPAPTQLIRYQLGNHLGSASLELDDHAQIISYEEYYPYGSTSYQAVRSQTETPKRYRYTGKERDEESGLYYHGARYYAAWLGRWTSCDPKSLSDGPNLHPYTGNNPVTYVDPAGRERLTINASVNYAEDNLVGTHASAKVEYQFPQMLSFQVSTDMPFTFLGLKWQGIAASGGNWRFSKGNQQLSHLHLSASTSVELQPEWRPDPLVVDLSLRGASDLSLYAPGEWFHRLAIAGGNLQAGGSAQVKLDFGRLGNFRVATPINVKLQAQLTASGIQFQAGYGYGTWIARSDRTYEGVYTESRGEGLHITIRKITSTDKGLGFFDRPASAQTSDPRPLSPSRKYQTQSESRTDPPPDPVGLLGEKTKIGWQQYFGPGYRKSTTVVGKSRFEIWGGLGIGLNTQYLPTVFNISAALKYEWW